MRLHSPQIYAATCCAILFLAVSIVSAENEKGTISGTIVLEDGSPANLKALLCSSCTTFNSFSFQKHGYFKNRFSIEIPGSKGKLSLTCYTNQYAPARVGPINVKFGQSISDVKITLKKGVSQRLKITDVDGRPIPETEVEAHVEFDGWTEGPPLKAKSNEKGECLYQHLAETRYEFKLKAPGFQPLTVDPIELKPDAILSIQMKRAELCTGVIQNADGTPAAGAKLQARIEALASGDVRFLNDWLKTGRREDSWAWGKAIAVADEKGQFVLDQLAAGANYLFVVEGPDQARVIVEDFKAGRENLRIKIPQRRDLIVQINGTLPELDRLEDRHYLLATQTKHVKTPDEGGYFTSHHNRAFVEKTDEGYVAVFRGLAADRNPDELSDEVVVSYGGQQLYPQTVKLEPVGVTRLKYDLKCTVSGTIVLEDGSPAPVDGAMHYERKKQNSSSSGTAGRFRDKFLLKFDPGTVWLTYYAEGYAPAWAGPIDVEADEEIKDIKLVLKRGFTQRLKITDVDGKPIPGVKIVAHPEINGKAGGPVSEKSADENGEYLYRHLADTKYVFHLKAPGFQPLTSDPIELEPDAVLPVHMRRANPCTGVILNADGTPAASAKIRGRIEVLKKGSSIQFGSGEDGFWGTVLATADEKGRFVLDQLRDGADYLLVVETADKARAVVHDLQAGNKNVQIKVPKRRDVRIAVTGDLSGLPQRSGKPFVAVRQRISFQPFPDYKYGDRIGEDAVLVKRDGQFTAMIRGLAVDLNSEFEQQEVEVSISYSRKHQKKVPIDPDGVTRVEFDLTKQSDE